MKIKPRLQRQAPSTGVNKRETFPSQSCHLLGDVLGGGEGGICPCLASSAPEQDGKIASKKPCLSFPFTTWKGVSPPHRQEIAGLKAFGQEPQLVRSGQSILYSQGKGEGQRDSGLQRGESER